MKLLASKRSLLSLTDAVVLSGLSCAAAAMQGASTENFGGRSMVVYVPSRLPARETRALVVVPHRLPLLLGVAVLPRSEIFGRFGREPGAAAPVEYAGGEALSAPAPACRLEAPPRHLAGLLN